MSKEAFGKHASTIISALKEAPSTILQENAVKSAVQYVVISGCLYLTHKGMQLLYQRLYEACTVTLTIDSRDEVYRWFLDWLSTHPYTPEARNLAVHGNSLVCFGFRSNPDQEEGEDTPYSRIRLAEDSSGHDANDQADETASIRVATSSSSPRASTSRFNAEESLLLPARRRSPFPGEANDGVGAGRGLALSRVLFTPGPGVHWLTYRGRWLKVERDRDNAVTSTSPSSSIRETLAITLFFASRRMAEQMIYEAVEQSLRHDANRTIVYEIGRAHV